MEKTLSILIPTYKRKQLLQSSLDKLIASIESAELIEEVKVIVSDNCSEDGTVQYLAELKNRTAVEVGVYEQNENIGYLENLLFLVEAADTPYAMTSGDDDQLSIQYIAKAVGYLKSDASISCIVGNSVPINKDGVVIGETHYKVEEDRYYAHPDKMLMLFGHTILGITFKVEGSARFFRQSRPSTLYPQMLLLGFNLCRGALVHITDCPSICQQDTVHLDWGYEEDGLMFEVFENIKLIAENPEEQYRLEKAFIDQSRWRIAAVLRRPKNVPGFIKKVTSSDVVTEKGKKYLKKNILLHPLLASISALFNGPLKPIKQPVKRLRESMKKDGIALEEAAFDEGSAK